MERPFSLRVTKLDSEKRRNREAGSCTALQYGTSALKMADEVLFEFLHTEIVNEICLMCVEKGKVNYSMWKVYWT